MFEQSLHNDYSGSKLAKILTLYFHKVHLIILIPLITYTLICGGHSHVSFYVYYVSFHDDFPCYT